MNILGAFSLLLTAALLSSCILFDDTGRRIHKPSALHEAIRKDDVARARQLVAEGYPTTHPQTEQTLLHAAGKSKSRDTIEFIFSLNPDIEQANEYGYTPIFMAEGLMLEELLRRGANPEARNDMEQTPVFIAHGEKLKTLLNHGARLDVKDDQGKTPFIYRAARLPVLPDATLPELELMLQYGADVNTVWEGQTVLDYWQQSAGEIKSRYKWRADLVNWEEEQNIMIPFLRAHGAKTSDELKAGL